MIVDYHVHLRGTSDGSEGQIALTTEAVERFVEVAVERGVDEIGFAEHFYYFRQFDSLITHPYQRGKIGHDLSDYANAVVEAKRSGLPVKLGLEVDYIPDTVASFEEILSDYPWDFLLGSVHLIGGEAVDLEPGIWDHLTVDEIWGRYFDLVRELAGSGLVRVLSHLDLVKIFGYRPPPEEMKNHYETTARAVAQSGVAVEVSTAGLRKRVGEIYPAPDFLHACWVRAIPITLASDAHVAQDVGRDFSDATELLRRTGYETLTILDGQQARQEPIG